MSKTQHSPRNPKSINEVVSSGLCIGCGLCQAIAPEVYSMQITENGALRPFPLSDDISKDTEILSACPGALVIAENDGAALHDSIWGAYTSMTRTWAGDPDVRFKAATGGVLTALGMWLLSSGRADFVLHCGADPAKPMRSRYVLSRTPEQVLKNTASRYGPSDTLAGLEAALQLDKPFALIAKPCDANAIRARAKNDKRLDKNLVAVLVMVCGGASDLGKSEAVLDEYGLEEDELSLFRYRGHGNPGPTRIETKSGQHFEKTYQEMWADESGWRIQSRCKLCPDPNGEAADLAAADIWPNANPVGEDEGFNGVIGRTAKGQSLIDAAHLDGALVSDLTLSPRDFDHFQPHQVHKKKSMAARLRGLAAAGQVVYAHKGLRIDELDDSLPEEEKGAYDRAKQGKFSEPWPPIPRKSSLLCKQTS